MKRAFYICCLIVFAGCVSAQQLNLKTYTVKDGLAHTNVSQIIQDKKGYLWFSTHGGGISSFDGKDFATYSEKNGLCSNLTRPIIQDYEGKFWIGALGGKVCIYDGKISKPFIPKGDTLPDKIYSIIEDHHHTIWFGGEYGVYIYDGKLLKQLKGKNEPPTVPVMHVYEDSKNRIWIASWEKGVYVYDGKHFQHLDMADGLSYHTAMSFNEDHTGAIWVSTFKGVSKIETISGNYKISKFNHPILDSTLIFKVVDDFKSKIYFATSGRGILTYDYKTNLIEEITTANGLPGSVVYNIFPDHESNLWIGCWGYGVTKYSGKRFVHYTKTEGLSSNAVQCINQDKTGHILLGTDKGLSAINKTVTTVFNKTLENTPVSQLLLDKQNGMWLATGSGVYYIKDGIAKKYTKEDGIDAYPASCMALDKKGNLWIGSWSGGVTKFDGKSFKNFTRQDGLGSPYIYSIYCDKKDNVWICTWDEGLCKIKDNDFTYFKVANGLPTNNVMSVRTDQQGYTWVATYGGGIARFDGTKFKVISSANGLTHDACNGILVDRQNNLWVATSKGLDKLNITAFNKNGTIDIRHYGAEEGFPALECLNNSMFEDKDGKLWFGTKNGVSCFTPSEDSRNTKEPLTQITKLRLFFEETDFKDFCDSISSQTELPVGLKLPYTSNHITFNFIGISYSVPEKVVYRFQLEGADKNWSPVTNKTEASYPGLQPGKYVFKVKACNNDGVWNKREVRFEFEILPPWYKTWWAYLSYLIIGISTYFITVKLRTKKLTEEKEKLELVVKERTHEIVQQKNLVEEKNKEITDSIQYAKRIQSTLLAHEEFLQENLAHHFVLFQPKDIVSGDFYWASKPSSESDTFYLAVCDSTGHGVPGAFMSLLNISFLNEAVNEKKILEPGQVFNYVREKLIANVSQDGGRDGMDAVLMRWDKANKRIEYAAAHNKPILIRDGKIIELTADKMPVGQGERKEDFVTHTINIEENDTIYLYTDGFADQFGGPKGKKFKYKQLNELLLQIHTKPLAEQQVILATKFSEWKADLEQVDDVCIIGIKV